MSQKLNCILLVDDNDADNFFHKLVISELHVVDNIQVAETGLEAINYLKKENAIIPQLIFLDINMPRMNGWEFLEEYKDLAPAQKAKIVIIMLTTSVNPEDKEHAEKIKEVNGFETKPLTTEKLNGILAQYFP